MIHRFEDLKIYKNKLITALEKIKKDKLIVKLEFQYTVQMS